MEVLSKLVSSTNIQVGLSRLQNQAGLVFFFFSHYHYLEGY